MDIMKIWLVVFFTVFFLFIGIFLFGPLGILFLALIGVSAVLGWIYQGNKEAEAYKRQEEAKKENNNDL